MTDTPKPTRLRVDPASVIVFSILLSPAAIGGAMTILKGGQDIPTGLALCAIYPFLLYWVSSPTVELLPGALVYRSLFKKREADLRNVSSVSLVSRPAPTLSLASGAGAPFELIVKPFSKAGVAAILQHIRSESPVAKFDEVSSDMARGDFGSVTRQTTSVANLLKIVWRVGGAALAGILAKALIMPH